MPDMQFSDESLELAPNPIQHNSLAQLPEPEVPPPLEDDRSSDLLEAQSIKYNVARIVRLSSGRFALFSHYRAGALDIIKMGTIEEIVDHIPTAEQCEPEPRVVRAPTKKDVSDLLADLGL